LANLPALWGNQSWPVCLTDLGEDRRSGQLVAHALMRAAFTVLTGVSGNKHVDVIGNKTFPIEG